MVVSSSRVAAAVAGAMALSSLSVVANANRLRRFAPQPLPSVDLSTVVPSVEIGGVLEPIHHTHRKETSMFGKKKSTTAKVVDPVCGMKIDPSTAAATREDDATTFYFCSTGCAEAFDADQHRSGHGEAHAGHHD